MRKLALAGSILLLSLGGISSAQTQVRYRYGYHASPYPYAYGPYGPGPYVAPGYYNGAPFCGPGPTCATDPYAAPHEIRGGYRTIYIPGRGRVIAAPPY